MKNTLFSLVATCIVFLTFSFTTAQAQSVFTKSSNIKQIGLGLGGGAGLSFSLDKGFREDVGPGNLGIGGIVAFRTWGIAFGRQTSSIFAARLTYHPHFVSELVSDDKFDAYAGFAAGIGYYSYSYNNDYFGDLNSNRIYPVVGFFLGARYFFSEKFGAFGEVGYGANWLTVGLCF